MLAQITTNSNTQYKRFWYAPKGVALSLCVDGYYYDDNCKEKHEASFIYSILNREMNDAEIKFMPKAYDANMEKLKLLKDF